VLQFGGNPVACTAVLAVLNVLKQDNLLEHSQEMGELFRQQLMQLKRRHQCIGDIRYLIGRFISRPYLRIICPNYF
jgi:4-aminobutyrate aminotransferase-like enzyme